MKEAGIEELPFETSIRQENDKQIVQIGAPRRPVNFELFSKSDIKVFNEIIAEYGNCNFEKLFRITHKHDAYRLAWGRRKPSSKRSKMHYEEMIDSPEKRHALLEDYEGIAHYFE